MWTILNHNRGKAMTDLTEKLKKGELSEGYYYIKTHGETNIDEYVQWYKDNEVPSEKSFVNFNVEQVLASVPSYEEYQQLKELLKECIIYVDRYVTFSTVRGNEERKVKSEELLTKINQVLGEDK